MTHEGTLRSTHAMRCFTRARADADDAALARRLWEVSEKIAATTWGAPVGAAVVSTGTQASP